jgi:mannosylfructose-phosphate synthase
MCISEIGRSVSSTNQRADDGNEPGHLLGCLIQHDLRILAARTLARVDAAEVSLESKLPRIAMISTHGYVASAPPLGAADTGGQVVYVIELSKKLAELGYEVDIWTRRFEDQPEIDPVNDHVRVIRIPCGGREFIPKEYLYERMPEWSKNALRFMKNHSLAYEFINSHYWDAGVGAEIVSSALGVPHVHTPHSLGLWKKRQMEQDFPGNAAELERQYNFSRRIHHERMIYEECDTVVATTPQQFDLLTRDYDAKPARCRMIPPGYDDNRFYPVGEASRKAIRQRLGFEGKVILAVGRLARNKGYDLLIDGFAVARVRIPDAQLYLSIGGATLSEKEKPLYEELEAKISALGLADGVRFLGFIPDEDLADYYRAADLFVLSSRYEPFGMTAVEAMACGTPNVVTAHGGLRRALTFGRHALIADPFDKEDLGIMICKVLWFPTLAERLSRMGAHLARSLFTWTGIAQQLVAAVEQRELAGAVWHDERWDDPWHSPD